DTVPITDSVSLTTVREFHSDHNISYSYIKMDLTDERIKLKLLTSDDGTDVLSYMSELVKTDENTVAALNGDFFSVHSGKKGFSLGIEKKDGTVLQSPINPDTMATVAYNGSDVLMTYLDFHVFAVAENWENKEIRHVNKHTSYYGDLLMYTHEFNGGYSPAPGGDVVEVVVEDGVVTEFRRDMEPCKIPENGCVLVLSEGSSMFLKDNFEVGSKIKFDWYFTPDLDGFDTAFGGGSMLVYEGKDVGKVGDYTHTVAGFNPRSAIGVDEEGETLYLVAVDGRQEASRGMRMSHLAELLIELGCYTAVNLDGGGSTRMLASTFWNPEMHAVNNPTENRRVINAIGIVLDNGQEDNEEPEEESEDEEASEDEELHDRDLPDSEEDEEYEEEQEQQEEQEEQTESSDVSESAEEDRATDWERLFGIDIRPERKTAFVGEKTGFEIVAYDEQLRPVYYNENDLELSVSEGEIEEGLVVSHTGGTVIVSAALGEYYAETAVYFMDSISGIVTDSVLYMKKGDERELPICVFDDSGRFVNVENTDDFEIVSSDENVVTVEANKIMAVGDGTALVTVSRNFVESYISVAVGSKTVEYTDSFEFASGRYYAYPQDTVGSFELSGDYSLSGDFSGKLSFDFTESPAEEAVETEEERETEETVETEETATLAEEKTDDVSRATYFSLYKNLVFAKGADMTLSVYSENDFNHEVRVFRDLQTTQAQLLHLPVGEVEQRQLCGAGAVGDFDFRPFIRRIQ
ncbi:MAG: phosphodiester glycosidase family protein, partial [Clostridia bacterium]|nr:phosphodiester glycosidase family protein [Clostridia bacterium]